MSKCAVCSSSFMVFVVLFVVTTCVYLDTAQSSEDGKTFITHGQLQEVNKLLQESQARAREGYPVTVLSTLFQTETDIFFRGLLGLKSSEPVLKPAKFDGVFQNGLLHTFETIYFEDVFVSRVPWYARKVSDMVQTISNQTVETGTGKAYFWIGGSAAVYRSGITRYYMLTQDSRMLKVNGKDGNVLSKTCFQLVQGDILRPSVLLKMDIQNSPAMCGGSGVITTSHGDNSQLLWPFNESISEELDGNLNRGNEIVNLTQSQLKALEDVRDEASGISINNLLLGGNANVEDLMVQSRDQYNNMAFLILSVAAMLSSAAVAGVSLGPGVERNAILAVEAIVIYSFLGLVSHACRMLTKKHNLLIEISTIRKGNFTYEDMVIEASHESVLTVAGERLQLPVLLIITEVFAVGAAAAVTGILVYNFRQMRIRWRRRSTGTLTEVGDYDYFPEKEA